MTDTTLIDELENMLGVPFTKKYIRKNMFRIEEFGIAAEFLRSVFESIKLPPKTEKMKYDQDSIGLRLRGCGVVARVLIVCRQPV